ncbi:MAG TPA: anthranilate synthase component I family protein [Planctomycetaceae bacterium]|nr:anthranilate synthase component I family protein [Planctomycetaceae bacterium]
MIPTSTDPETLAEVRELPSGCTPESVWQCLAALPHCIFFDSAAPHTKHGRYSFVAADPFERLVQPRAGTDIFALLRSRLADMATPRLPDLPPFQGGWAGVFGYELGQAFETYPCARFDEFAFPVAVIAGYDVVFAFDHSCDRAWIISQGLPETEPSARKRRARKRLEQFWELATASETPLPSTNLEEDRLDISTLAPQFPTHFGSDITSTFSRADYEAAVARVIEYIRDGDVFQVNLSQRLLAPQRLSSVELYQRLRRRNPAPFAAYFDAGPFQILSASPERFLRVHDRVVHTHPIKGTRFRSPHVEADLFAADDLLASSKDRAENTMIVDLLRNDLSRVCRDDSIFVETLCGLQRYQFVQHLVSVVRGELREGADALELLAVAFPGGSITGAPKIRAMEIIAELEPTVRGPYCGSLAYLGLDGSFDSSILIRTITAGRGWCQIPVGGGIVADSRPTEEYEETCHKARGLVEVVSGYRER